LLQFLKQYSMVDSVSVSRIHVHPGDTSAGDISFVTPGITDDDYEKPSRWGTTA